MSDDEQREAADRAAREIADMLLPVFEGTRTLDEALAEQPPLVTDRKPSLLHILSVFGSESPQVKRELAYHLFRLHTLNALNAGVLTAT